VTAVTYAGLTRARRLPKIPEAARNAVGHAQWQCAGAWTDSRVAALRALRAALSAWREALQKDVERR